MLIIPFFLKERTLIIRYQLPDRSDSNFTFKTKLVFFPSAGENHTFKWCLFLKVLNCFAICSNLGEFPLYFTKERAQILNSTAFIPLNVFVKYFRTNSRLREVVVSNKKESTVLILFYFSFNVKYTSDLL